MTVSLEKLAKECGVENEVNIVERAAVAIGGGEYCSLDCKQAWDGLSEKEKKYAHYLCAASWSSCPVSQHQASRESATLFLITLRCFRGPRTVSEIIKAITAAVGNEEVTQRFVEYCGFVLSNMGNYLGFGDSKFVPRLTRAQYMACVRAAVAGQSYAADTEKLAESVLDAVFKLNPANLRRMGFDDAGVTSYYTADVSRSEAEAVQAILDRHHSNAVNTRCAKTGEKSFRVVAASAEPTGEVVKYEEDGIVVEVVRGDFSKYMARVAENLDKAAEYAPREVESKMMHEYSAHFRSGDVEMHKQSQRTWVTDRNPVVEFNIGFIETYRDPLGVRAEWEGWVAVVNKELSRCYTNLVELAPKVLPLLPWGPAFEKPSFIKPDFTAIDVLAYATSSIPLGINLPNYDDVREAAGFKNVSLMNVLYAGGPTGKVPFLSEEDGEFYKNSFAKSFEINIGLHELLGHGSGRVLVEGSFDPAQIISPLTGKPITSWYKSGQTYDSVFKSLGSSMEECRAESVSLVLIGNPEVLRCFDYNPDELKDGVHDMTFACYMRMFYSGFRGLETYNASTNQWLQAHARARWGILRAALKASKEVAARTGKKPAVQIVLSEDKKDVFLEFDRSQVNDVLLPAVTDLLLHLQVYRATADFENGKRMWEELTAVDLTDPVIATAYDLVLKSHKPRRQFVQPVTQLDGDSVRLLTFPPSVEGMIESYEVRYPNDDAIDLNADKIF